jgi:formate hydrogenlyase subunit 6/NADH:ubiquinone oxidoreductase subunit I
METLFTSELKPLLDAIAGQMELYVPKKSGEFYVFKKYDPAVEQPVEFNNIRACTPVKEFLFPMREIAAIFPESAEPEQVEPFALFGLKECDLRSIEILDKVFMEEEFEDPFYVKRRENMFIITSDCFEPGESCFCHVFDAKPYSESGFDLNVSRVKGGFIVEAGSENGQDFIKKHSELFQEIPQGLLAERDKVRADTQERLEQQNAGLRFDEPIRDVVDSSQDSDVYDVQAKGCIECQACTRICPTCHCFYLYDTKQKDYFGKMKMWDSCMRQAYAEVAGGANPHKILGDRIKHRLMHKFVHFLDRYGIDMCVGCGRCVDADAGGMDIREVLKQLREELKDKGKRKTKVGK